MDTREIREFRRVLRQFERINSVQLKSCCSGVTLAQCLVLLEIDENGHMTGGQLASRLRLDSSTLSRTIDSLVRGGLVERQRDDRDRRVVWIALTADGDSVCRSIHRDNDARYREVFDRIPPSRRRTVLRNFRVLVQAFLDNEGASREDE